MSTTTRTTRTTPEPVRPEQVRLPGQAAAPEGPVDMLMMYVMHHAFRRDLRRFAVAAEHTPATATATWVALAERWDLFAEILHGHHTGEDTALWPALLERADESERATLVAMEAEHARIDPLLTSCHELVHALAAGPDAVQATRLRARLALVLAQTRESLGRHLAHEESEAIAIIQRHLTQEEWKRIEEEGFHEKRPISFLLHAVSWIADDLPPAARNRAFAEAGQAMRVVWWLGRRRYHRGTRAAFGFVPDAG
ncbi:hemerythrin domain-containing protein [Nocardioides sambongensis]|uniref:hemerythrin domain-containing protein n=1 Tax=Nocardioides sambongensis TaxID=2589074 RepID=UPI00112876C3|nr:hemerythrin domain-containing protein [Nocardioides sambongensis]